MRPYRNSHRRVRVLLQNDTHHNNELNVYRASHTKRNYLSTLATPPTGLNLDQNNWCDFDMQMHGCLDLSEF